ncbi:MAG TPA: hypothetical protein VMM16_15135 [Verrucomicrobiae bacterium]|nr:hypothetical protein [Verrucomicrobiae bacterium]
MRQRFAVTASVAALVLCSFATFSGRPARGAGGNSPAAPDNSCDYACLTGMVDRYLKAVAAHDPTLIPAADHVKFTENTITLRLGDALWGTMSGMGTYKLYFADPHDGEAAFEGTIRENDTPAILLLRLRVVDGKITEVETLVHRNADAAKALEKFGNPDPAWLKPLDAAQKTSRQDMLQAADTYFEGILHSSGDMVPFDPRCNRILDGYQDTNNPTAKGWFDKDSFRPDAMGIRENLNTGIWKYIHSIDPRRYVVVDEKMGIVLGMFMFNHPGKLKSVDVPGVGTVPMPPVTRRPSSVEMGEFFKIEGGKIRQIEGISISLPYGAGEGW